MKTIIGLVCLLSAVAVGASTQTVVCQVPGAPSFTVRVAAPGTEAVPTVVPLPSGFNSENTLSVSVLRNGVGANFKPGASGRHTVEMVLTHIENGFEALAHSLSFSVVFPYSTTISYARSNQDESEVEIAFIGVSCDLK